MCNPNPHPAHPLSRSPHDTNPPPSSISNIQSDKYHTSASAPPSSLAAVAAAHPLMPPAASSSSRPPSLAMPHTLLSNMPLSYPYPPPSTASLPPPPHHHHHQQHNPPSNDLQSLACLTHPVPNPLAHSIHPHIPHHQIPHSDPQPITQQPTIHHHPIPSSLAPHPSSLTAAAAAAAAAAVATPAERQIISHPQHPSHPNLVHHHASAIQPGPTIHPNPATHAAPPLHTGPTIQPTPTLHPTSSPIHPTSSPIHPIASPIHPISSPIHHTSAPIQSAPIQQPIVTPYPTDVPQHQRHPSPTNSEAADAPSTDGIGPGSTGGGASTVGAASLDGAGGISGSGSSSGNVTDDRTLQNTSAAPTPPDVGAVSSPPSSGRRVHSSRVDSPETERPNKRPHRSISHAEKRRLCEISNAHPSAKHGHIASVFLSETGRRIERSTVTRVLQRKDFWMSAGTRDSNRKRLTSPRFPSIEEALFELIRNRTRVPALRAMLTDKELMKYSKDIAEVMRNDNGSMDKSSPNYAPHLRSFRGSLSWVTSFKKRNALMSPEDKTLPVRPFVPNALPGETLDIWATELDIAVATDVLQDGTRLEDMYFLDSIALAASARPENTAISSKVTSLTYDSTAGIDEAFGIVEAQNQEREGSSHDATSAAIPQIEFSMPILSSSTPGMSNPMSTNDNSNVQNGMSPQTGDNYPGMSSAVNQSQPAQVPTEPRHPVDEDTIVYALFCSNGMGNDKRPPWLVGKKALAEMGSKPGEVWPGCPVRYFHNKQGWITGRLTRKWFEEFDKSVDRKVVVVTSLLNSCDLELLDLKHVSILPIPRIELGREKEAAVSWSSSSASPMHHGIEQMFRAKYRSLVMERALQQMGEQKPLKNLPMQGVATTLKDAWDKVPIPVIRRAWRELPYLPSKFSRSTNRPRSSSNKPMWVQALLELNRLVMTYRDAISSYSYAEEIELRQSDVFGAVAEVSDYIWLSVEEGPFHPSGTIQEFSRSACADTPMKDDGSDQTKVVKAIERSFQIQNHEDALDLVNKLANFIKSDQSLGNQQNLYLAGSLQLNVKKECDRRRNEADARDWIEANRQRTSGLP